MIAIGSWLLPAWPMRRDHLMPFDKALPKHRRNRRTGPLAVEMVMGSTPIDTYAMRYRCCRGEPMPNRFEVSSPGPAQGTPPNRLTFLGTDRRLDLEILRQQTVDVPSAYGDQAVVFRDGRGMVSARGHIPVARRGPQMIGKLEVDLPKSSRMA